MGSDFGRRLRNQYQHIEKAHIKQFGNVLKPLGKPGREIAKFHEHSHKDIGKAMKKFEEELHI